MIYIGADHGGFKLKEDVKAFMKSRKIPFVDVGAKTLQPEDDYPKYALGVAKEVSKNPGQNKGVLICRSGHGICIAANKLKNVRAALCWNEALARAARNDDDANVLCLPANYISGEVAEDTLITFLKTQFSGEERHKRRIKEISQL